MGRAILSNLKEGVAIANSVKRSSEKTEVATYGGRRRVEVVGMWSEPRRGRWPADSWPSVGECARFGFLVGLGVVGGVMVVEKRRGRGRACGGVEVAGVYGAVGGARARGRA